MSDLAFKLYEYNVWANQQIFNRLKELPKEVYHQENSKRVSVNIPCIVACLSF